jgi:Tfp pilus assembly protein PilZ
MGYQADQPYSPSNPVCRIIQTSARPKDACKMCGGRPVSFEDDSDRSQFELFGFCEKCLDELLGFRQHRRYHRVPGQRIVRVSVDRSFPYAGLIRDISVVGAFILTNAQYSVGNDITVAFLSIDKRETLRVRGKIVRVAQDGVAVVFERSAACQSLHGERCQWMT